MKKQIMKRAWEIYRTLVGDKAAKLSYALKKAWAEVKTAVKTVTDGKWTFEVVDVVPDGYQIWSVGNIVDGYIPMAQVKNNHINPETLKAVKVSDSATIMAGCGYVSAKGKNIIKAMETYVKKYSGSKRIGTLYRVEKIKKALDAMSEIKWA